MRCVGLQGTQTEQKNELLFSKFGINYAKLPVRFRKVRQRLCSQACHYFHRWHPDLLLLL